MKILTISHSCIVDVNQQVWLDLNRIPGVDVALVLPSTWISEYNGSVMTPKYLPDVTAEGLPVHPLPVVKPGHNSFHFYRSGLGDVLDREKPDVVFLDEEPWSLVALQVVTLCGQRKIPFVCYTKQNLFKRYPPPFRWIERRTHVLAQKMLTISDETTDVLRRKGFRGEASVLPHACDLRLFFPRPSDDLRAKLGIAPGDIVVGYMGRLTPEKGLDTLVDALAWLKPASGARVVALLIGSGVAEETLRKQAEERGVADRVLFPGAVPHLEAGKYMACMDIFALTSRTTPAWKEQFGRVIIEALASGVPVVGSDSGEIPNLIRATGGGRIFPEGNADALASRLKELVDDPALRARLAENGGAVVRERYTSAAVAQRIYEEIAGPHPIRK